VNSSIAQADCNGVGGAGLWRPVVAARRSYHSGVDHIPLPESHRFFLYKAFKPAKTARHFTKQVFQPRQMDEKRIVHFFENFSSQLPKKMLKGGFLTKRGIIKLPRIKRFALRLGFPFANGLLLDSRPTNK
jgi:hypothetical protein